MTAPGTAPHRLPHRPGLDGLRAIAVTGVLLYHAEVSWLPGGFLGVDVFFAISGYLIASLLLAEHAATGDIALKQFWARRARRLLPAVAVLLVGVTLAALAGAHDALARLRGDVFAALTYVSNWWQIARGETYFETFGRPPLLRHLWSLAVEEQLYLALPIAFSLAGRRGLLARRRVLATGALAGAFGSVLLLNLLWEGDDPSRAWFGTDTRASGLLVGVACALAWPMADRQRWSGRARACIDVAGIASVVGLAVVMLTMSERGDTLPRVGFGLTAVLAGTAVVAITGPASRVGRVLAVRPLRWIGTRSYAIYLWHWPVLVLTRPRLDGGSGGPVPLVVQLLLTAALAEASWRLVEQPFRTGTAQRAWRELTSGVRVRVAVGGAGAIAVLTVALAVGLSSADPVSLPELLATVAKTPTTATTLARIAEPTPTTAATTTSTLPPTTAAAGPTAAPVPSAPAVPAPVPAPATPASGAVLAVGDSVMLAARDALISGSGGRIQVDAAIGRQVDEGLTVLQHYRDAGTFSQISALVVHLGTNGPMTDELFNRLAVIVEGVPRVVLLNVRVPKEWEGQSNAAINGGVTRFPAMRLADWYRGSSEPGALANDGVHPSPAGARIYGYLVMEQLG